MCRPRLLLPDEPSRAKVTSSTFAPVHCAEARTPIAPRGPPGFWQSDRLAQPRNGRTADLMPANHFHRHSRAARPNSLGTRRRSTRAFRLASTAGFVSSILASLHKLLAIGATSPRWVRFVESRDRLRTPRDWHLRPRWVRFVESRSLAPASRHGTRGSNRICSSGRHWR